MLHKLKLKYLLIITALIGLTIGIMGFNKEIFSPLNHHITYIQDKFGNAELAPKLVIIPAGEGTIGGKNFRSFQNEAPEFKAIIEKPYALSETEITFEQYDLFCKATSHHCPEDEGWGRQKQPVINVSWLDAVAYTQWLTKQTGHQYRLPSEVEWEYAARAGQNTKFWWGNNYMPGLDHCDRDLGDCPKGSETGHPWQVKTLNANPFGLYDVTSNVSEWIADCYSDSHHNATGSVKAKSQGKCNEKVAKGASWLTAQPYVHHSSRISLPKGYTSYAVGFRVLREINTSEVRD